MQPTDRQQPPPTLTPPTLKPDPLMYISDNLSLSKLSGATFKGVIPKAQLYSKLAKENNARLEFTKCCCMCCMYFSVFYFFVIQSSKVSFVII